MNKDQIWEEYEGECKDAERRAIALEKRLIDEAARVRDIRLARLKEAKP